MPLSGYNINQQFTRRMPKIRGLESLTSDIIRSMIDMLTNEPSMMFQPELKYASSP